MAGKKKVTKKQGEEMALLKAINESNKATLKNGRKTKKKK